ncbi:MAG: type I 3-dehydroquinate dehydratase, partial [Candidatus Hydrogenedentota bacterium]
MSANQMKLGRCLLRHGNLNIVSLIFGTRRTILADARKSVMLGVRLAEFRADLSMNSTQGDFSKIVGTLKELRKECPSLALIGTIRQFVQYGSYRGTEADRLDAFEKMIPFLDAIDIELVADQIQKRVIGLAREQGKTVIVSHHAIFDMPSTKQLGRWAAAAGKLEPDLVKLSLKGRTTQDLERLLA